MASPNEVASDKPNANQREERKGVDIYSLGAALFIMALVAQRLGSVFQWLTGLGVMLLIFSLVLMTHGMRHHPGNRNESTDNE